MVHKQWQQTLQYKTQLFWCRKRLFSQWNWHIKWIHKIVNFRFGSFECRRFIWFTFRSNIACSFFLSIDSLTCKSIWQHISCGWNVLNEQNISIWHSSVLLWELFDFFSWNNICRLSSLRQWSPTFHPIFHSSMISVTEADD